MPVQIFTAFDDPLATDHFTNATGINASGNIVGFYEASAVVHGFLLSGGTYTTIDPLGGTSASAQSINDIGQIAGSYRDSAGPNPHGFLFSEGTYTIIDDPLATKGTNAIGVNNNGQIVGEYLNANRHSRLPLERRRFHHPRRSADQRANPQHPGIRHQ
jgi:uncharacterized membrane protein